MGYTDEATRKWITGLLGPRVPQTQTCKRQCTQNIDDVIADVVNILNMTKTMKNDKNTKNNENDKNTKNTLKH